MPKKTTKKTTKKAAKTAKKITKKVVKKTTTRTRKLAKTTKPKTVKAVVATTATDGTPVKRGRGRPRKIIDPIVAPIQVAPVKDKKGSFKRLGLEELNEPLVEKQTVNTSGTGSTTSIDRLMPVYDHDGKPVNHAKIEKEVKAAKKSPMLDVVGDSGTVMMTPKATKPEAKGGTSAPRTQAVVIDGVVTVEALPVDEPDDSSTETSTTINIEAGTVVVGAPPTTAVPSLA